MHMGTIVLSAVWLAAAIGAALLMRHHRRLGGNNDYDVGAWATLIAATFIVSLVLGLTAANSNECSIAERKLGVETEYSWLLGCTVEFAGRQVPLDNVRINEVGDWITDEGNTP